MGVNCVSICVSGEEGVSEGWKEGFSLITNCVPSSEDCVPSNCVPSFEDSVPLNCVPFPFKSFDNCAPPLDDCVPPSFTSPFLSWAHESPSNSNNSTFCAEIVYDKSRAVGFSSFRKPCPAVLSGKLPSEMGCGERIWKSTSLQMVACSLNVSARVSFSRFRTTILPYDRSIKKGKRGSSRPRRA